MREVARLLDHTREAKGSDVKSVECERDEHRACKMFHWFLWPGRLEDSTSVSSLVLLRDSQCSLGFCIFTSLLSWRDSRCLCLCKEQLMHSSQHLYTSFSLPLSLSLSLSFSPLSLSLSLLSLSLSLSISFHLSHVYVAPMLLVPPCMQVSATPVLTSAVLQILSLEVALVHADLIACCCWASHTGKGGVKVISSNRKSNFAHAVQVFTRSWGLFSQSMLVYAGYIGYLIYVFPCNNAEASNEGAFWNHLSINLPCWDMIGISICQEERAK